VPVTVVVAGLVVWKHKENIARLRAGEEKPWTKKSVK
jgi:glycerol-3-phosphate acyltransferase PlsY